MRYIAYWISPSGKIIPTEITHIASIIRNPELFGLDRTYIEKLYKKYKEHIGQEGKARNEIMTDLMKKNWIRVRYVDTGGWYFEVIRLNERQRDSILDFISKGMKDGFINKYTQISVGQVNGTSSSSSASDIVSGEVELECKMSKKMSLVSLLKEVMKKRKEK